MTMWSGAFSRASSFFHSGDKIIGDGATDAAVREFHHIVFGAGLVAAAFEDVPVHAQIAKFVDD